MEQQLRSITKLAGMQFQSAGLLATGSTSIVWRVSTAQRELVVRFLQPKNGVLQSSDFEFKLRGMLVSSGARIAQPILRSEDVESIWPHSAWVMDEFIPGIMFGRGQLPPEVCKDLGETLTLLHSMDARNFGKPRFIGAIAQGENDQANDALAMRFDKPWPILSGELEQHEVGRQAPELIPKLVALQPDIIALVENSSPVILHTDLHDKQFICSDKGLVALIDFADAIVGDPSWDFGSLYYFHGEKVTTSIIEAYDNRKLPKTEALYRARLLAIVIACHQATRSRLPGKSHRLPVALNVLRQITSTTVSLV